MIDPETLPTRARRVYQRLIAGGLEVYLRDVTSDTRIATFMCVVRMRRGPDTYHAHGGYGCHPDARVAAVRALTEAAQSRMSFIQGGREDLTDPSHDVVIESDAEFALDGGNQADFASVPTAEHALVGDDVAWIVERFKAVGLSQVVAIDLTRPELSVPVVRVVVPRANRGRYTICTSDSGHRRARHSLAFIEDVNAIRSTFDGTMRSWRLSRTFRNTTVRRSSSLARASLGPKLASLSMPNFALLFAAVTSA